MFSYILRVFQNPFSFSVWLISFCTVSLFWYSYSEIDYVAANYQSYSYAYFDTFLSWGVIVFLPLILSGIVYKSLLFGYKKSKTQSSHALGVLGGILGVFITGATCCGVTLISLLGLTGVIGFLEILPYHGIEIKAIGFLFLFFAWWDLYTHLDICAVPKKKKPLLKKDS